MIANIRKIFGPFELKMLMIGAFIALWMIFVLLGILTGLSSDLHTRAKQLLGGSVILESPSPITDNVISKISALPLQTTHNLEFYTMAVARDQFLLIKVDAFSDPYPLNGQ